MQNWPLWPFTIKSSGAELTCVAICCVQRRCKIDLCGHLLFNSGFAELTYGLLLWTAVLQNLPEWPFTMNSGVAKLTCVAIYCEQRCCKTYPSGHLPWTAALQNWTVCPFTVNSGVPKLTCVAIYSLQNRNNQIWNFRRSPHKKFNRNPSSGRRAVTDRQTGEHDEHNRRFARLCKLCKRAYRCPRVAIVKVYKRHGVTFITLTSTNRDYVCSFTMLMCSST